MGVRLKGEYYSTSGELWTWQLIDTGFGDLQHDTLLTSEGLVFSWDGDDIKDSRFIISKCSFTIIVNHNYIEDFITDIIDAAEGRFFLRAGKDGGVTYIGRVAVDGGEYEDNAWPIEFRLVSVDGLGGLSGINYSDTTGVEAPFEGGITLLDHIFNCLDKTKLTDHYTGQDYLWINCNWYEDQHFNNTDNPFDVTRVDGSAFYSVSSETGKYDYKSSHDVLNHILINFGASLMYVGPHFLLQQRNERANASFKVFKYNTSHGLISSGNVSDEITISNAAEIVYRQGGSSFGFLPGMRMASIEYEHGEQDVNLLNGLSYEGINDSGTPDGTLVSVGSITVGATENVLLRFKGKLKIKSTSGTGPWRNHRYLFKLRLKIVSTLRTYWWSRHFTPFDFFSDIGWSTPPIFVQVDDYYDVVTGVIDEKHSNINVFTDVGFDTYFLDQDAVSEIFFGWEITRVYDEKDLDVEEGSNPDICEWTFEDLDLSALTNGTTLNRPTKTISEVTGNVLNSYSILEKTIIGDGPGKTSKGRLQVNNGTEWRDSAFWKAAGAGTSRKLHLIAAQEMLAAQESSLLVIQGGFYDTSNSTTAMSRISYTGLKFLLMSGRYTTAADLWEGSWARIITPVRTGLTWVDKTLLKQEKVPTPLNPHPLVIDEPKEKRVLGVLTSDGILNTIAITTIDILEAATTNLYYAGDILNLIDPITGNVQKVTVSVDVHEGDTSISIESVTPDEYFPPGSYLEIDEKYQVTNVFSETGMAYQFELSFSGFELVCTHTLTDLTKESDQEILSLRHLVYKNGTKLILNHPLGWHIENVGNKIIFEEECFSDSIEVYTHKVQKVY